MSRRPSSSSAARDPVGALARADDHLDAGVRQRVDARGRAPRRRRSRSPAPRSRSRTSRPSSGRRARGVEDDPGRLAHGVDAAGGEQGVVGDRGLDPDGDRVEVGAPAMDELAARVAGDPLRVARRGGGAAVERQRRLEHDQRPAGAGALAEGLVEQPGRGGLGALGPLDLDARRRAGSPGRGRSPSRSGRRRRSRRGRSRRRGSRRCRAAGGPGGRRARASRTSSRRATSAPRSRGVVERRDLGVAAAELGVAALAEHVARRRRRSPRRPAGWG